MLYAHGCAGREIKRVLTVGMLATLAALTFAASASAEGNFVIGDGNAAIGSSVTFWGAKWAKLNTLSEGSAPRSFKGFADEVATTSPKCGTEWSTRPGNSSGPPEGPLPGLIEVIVASEITKSGPTISGNTKEVVLVKTEEPGYASNPGHAGTGTVVGVVCGGEYHPG